MQTDLELYTIKAGDKVATIVTNDKGIAQELMTFHLASIILLRQRH